MPQWSRSEYDVQAAKIAQAFQAGGSGADLTEMTLKVSRDACLNPDQISTLARAVNTNMFNVKRAAMEGQPDRHVDFNVCRDQDIISALFNSSIPGEKLSHELYPALPDHMRAHRGGVTPPVSSPSAEKLAASIDQQLGGKERPERLAIRYAKVAEDLGMQARQLVIRRNEKLATLTRYLRGIYVSRDDFEKNAVALFGGNALPELNEIRVRLHILPLQACHEKLAAVQERLIGRENPESRVLSEAIDAREKIAEVEAACQIAQARATQYRNEAMGRG